MKAIKRIIKFLSPVLYGLILAYWFIFRPTTRGAKIILTSSNEILLLRHTYNRFDTYSLPGGGVRKEETPKEAVVREVGEELGVTIHNPIPVGSFSNTGEYKKDTIFVFTTELKTKVLDINNIEISETGWFPIDHLPPLGPVTTKLISMYREYKK